MNTTARNNAPAALPVLAVILAALAMIGPFTIDTYLPSFPHIGAEFAATPAQLQQTLSLYLFTLALMTLFHGTLSDSFGRRPVILASLAVYALASIGCAMAASLPQLLLWRALQGLSAGAGIIVAVLAGVSSIATREFFEGYALVTAALIIAFVAYAPTHLARAACVRRARARAPVRPG